MSVSNLILRYRDPLTGKHVRKSSGTANPKDARKAAARWEDELNSGKARGRYAVTWEQFTLRYEEEVLPSLAPRTADKAGGVFNVLEAVLPQVKNGLLRELTAERVSVLQAELRKRGRAEATIAGYLAHLRAALAWAVDQGLLAELPKMKRPKRAKRSGGADPMKGRPITTEEFERMLGKVAAGLAPEPTKPKPEGQRKRKPRKTEAAGSYHPRGGRIVETPSPRAMVVGAAVGRSPATSIGTAPISCVWTSRAGGPCCGSWRNWRRAAVTGCCPSPPSLPTSSCRRRKPSGTAECSSPRARPAG